MGAQAILAGASQPSPLDPLPRMCWEEDRCPPEAVHEEPQARPAAQSRMHQRRVKQRDRKRLFRQQEMAMAALHEHASKIESADDIDEDFQVVPWPILSTVALPVVPPLGPILPTCAMHLTPEQLDTHKDLPELFLSGPAMPTFADALFPHQKVQIVRTFVHFESNLDSASKCRAHSA
eukprot:NODE_3862_length_735_cov_76.120588.p1 GENE.NODE_3862_length_735_cov_76.120588~~NODE_3862_length_735_cov_76.120588.p1  ORF type:complete len:178 (+),score=15.75 NODE_3862_length_735_cov_76.120588:3-536(+)